MVKKIKSEDISFSVLMANFNNACYIKEAIKSVISQTFTKWELIIVDDCSTDNSVEVIKPFLKDKRIKLICHKKNLGYGGSLRTAADKASNIIIGILDPDDKLHETALAVMADSFITYSEYGFIYSTYWNCDSHLKNCVVNKEIGKIIHKNRVFFRIRIGHFKTFRKDLYDKTSGFDPTMKRAVDKDIIFKLEELAKFKFIDIPLYYYRQHKSGISQGKSKFEAYIFSYIAKLKAYQRRLNTDLPNCTPRELYRDYFLITFNRLLIFTKMIYQLFKISMLNRLLLTKFPRISRIIKEKIKLLFVDYWIK